MLSKAENYTFTKKKKLRSKSAESCHLQIPCIPSPKRTSRMSEQRREQERRWVEKGFSTHSALYCGNDKTHVHILEKKNPQEPT